MGSLDPEVQEAFKAQADTLTSHLNRELDTLRKIEEARERARIAKEEERDKARLAKLEAAERAAKASDNKMAFLLEQQAAQEEAANDRRKFWQRYVLAPVLTTVMGGGGVLGYLQATDQSPPEVKAEDVQETVDKRVEDLERRQAVQVQRVRRLADLHYETLELILDQGDEQNDKLDAIADKLRVREDIPEPDTVHEAREEVRAYKRRRQREGRPASVKGDPFAGIDDHDHDLDH